MTATSQATIDARQRVRHLMAVEGDLAFRRRCETIVEWLDAKPGDTILDCGSGYGFVLRVLLELTENSIVGLEYQQERVDETRAFLGDNERLTLVQGDAMALPFPDHAFDHVVCSEVLEHLPDDTRAVQELYRVLKPGGTLVVTVPSADFPFTWDPPNWILKRLGNRHLGGERPWSGIWYGHRRLYRDNELHDLVSNAGFDVTGIRGITHLSPPFAHLLLYGIGKPLIQAGLVPSGIRKQADRKGNEASPPRGVAGFAMKVLNRIDRPNDAADLQQRRDTFVAIGIRAIKPAAPDPHPAASTAQEPSA